MDVNPICFQNIPNEITFYILNHMDCTILSRMTTVCGKWLEIIAKIKRYQEFKLFQKLTIAKSAGNSPTKLKTYLNQAIYYGMLLQKNKVLEYLKKNSFFNVLHTSCPSHCNLPPLLFFCYSHVLTGRQVLDGTKIFLDLGSDVNVVSNLGYKPNRFKQLRLKEYTTALWIAAVKNNYPLVLRLKSRGGVVYPPLNRLVPAEAKALSLLKKANNRLFTAPVRLLEGKMDGGSILFLLHLELVERISKIFFSLFH